MILEWEKRFTLFAPNPIFIFWLVEAFFPKSKLHRVQGVPSNHFLNFIENCRILFSYENKEGKKFTKIKEVKNL